MTLPFVVRTVQPVLEELDADVEEAAASLGASRFTTFRRIILPSLVPAIAAGAALSFARGDQRVRLAGAALAATCRTRPRSPRCASYTYIEDGNQTSAAAVATLLLVVALVVIVALDIIQRRVARRG